MAFLERRKKEVPSKKTRPCVRIACQAVGIPALATAADERWQNPKQTNSDLSQSRVIALEQPDSELETCDGTTEHVYFRRGLHETWKGVRIINQKSYGGIIERKKKKTKKEKKEKKKKKKKQKRKRKRKRKNKKKKTKTKKRKWKSKKKEEKKKMFKTKTKKRPKKKKKKKKKEKRRKARFPGG